MWTKLANPGFFMRWSGRLLPWFAGATVLVFTTGLYMSFFMAPPDYQQGETIRIMYIHVPSAWMALFLYTMMSISAIGTLVWRHPLADVSQKAAAHPLHPYPAGGDPARRVRRVLRTPV
ncbi:MAG: cytochrome c biogenesis protein CcsA, partial [Salinarimonas sp.]